MLSKCDAVIVGSALEGCIPAEEKTDFQIQRENL